MLVTKQSITINIGWQEWHIVFDASTTSETYQQESTILNYNAVYLRILPSSYGAIRLST